ncbi:hypothetical protein [Kribbella sp. C-35]|uniref:hypothetical protein n=1 Tax=Kribbella sp. C-35 TaxID=2789276 RepID=UPI00397947F3
MRRQHLLVAGIGLALLATSAGCAAPPAASERSSPLATWRATTAETVGRLLVEQGDGATIGLPTGVPRPTDTLAAGITLQLAQRPTPSVDELRANRGLLQAEGTDPLFVTWLAARFSTKTLDRDKVTAAARQRMANLAKGTPEAAGAYLTGSDLLRLLGATPPAPAPTPSACQQLTSALAQQDLINASTWSELAAAAGRPCSTEATKDLIGLAQTRLAAKDGVVGPYTAAELWAGQRVLAAAGRAPVVPALCPALLTEKRSLRISRDTMTYLACADASIAKGDRPDLSDDVASWLDLVVRTRGRLAEQQTLDPMGKLYETQSLHLLGFPSDVLATVRADRTSGGGDDVEARLLRAFAQGQVPAAELPAGANASAVMLSAASVLGGAQCPRTVPRDFTAARVGAAPDTDALFREALVAKALERCGGNSTAWTASVLKRLAVAERSLGNDLIGRWKAQESHCVLTGRPTLSETAALRLLPNYSLTNPKFELSLDSLYAGVRLSEIVDRGCAGAFWDRVES